MRSVPARPIISLTWTFIGRRPVVSPDRVRASNAAFELRSRKGRNGHRQARACGRTAARNQRGGIGHSPEMVAAFVRPNDPAVDHILRAAAQALQASGKSGSIDDLHPRLPNAPGNWPPRSGLPFCNANSTTPCRRPVLSIVARTAKPWANTRCWLGDLPGSDPAICILPGTGKPQPVACLHPRSCLCGPVVAR